MKTTLIRLIALLSALALAPDALAIQSSQGPPINHFHLEQPREPEIAASTAGHLVVWRDEIVDHSLFNNLYGQHLDADGKALSARFVISNSPDSHDPSVASFVSTNVGLLYVVAYERFDKIYARTIAPGSTVPGEELEISGNPGFQYVKPDVGFGLGICRIVYQITNKGISGANVWVNSFGDFEIHSSFVVSIDPEDREPAIVQHKGGGAQTMVTWSRDIPTIDEEIHARSWTGALPEASDPIFLVATTLWNAEEPDVSASRDDEFMVTWSEIEPGSSLTRDVYARRIAYLQGPGNGETLGGVLPIAVTPALDEREPVIQCTGNAYLIAVLREAASGSTPFSVRSHAVDALGTNVISSSTTAGAVVARGHALAARTPESLGIDMALSYIAKDTWLTAQNIENRGGAVSTYTASGCPIGGEALVSTATGGNPAFRMELRGAPPFMPSWLILSPAQLSVNFGSATLIPDFNSWLLSYRGLTTPKGGKVLDLPLPPSLTGFPVFAQWATTDPTLFSNCTNRWFNLSDAVRFDVD